MKLVPHQGWWAANFNAPGGEFSIYVDVGMPAEWDGDVVRIVDLDLDVVRFADQSVAVLDRDEFDDHRVRYRYPPDLVETALATSEWLIKAIDAEPFCRVAASWLKRFEAGADGWD